MSAVSYKLYIDGKPTSSDFVSTIQKIEVEDHARMADMLRLQVAISVKESGTSWNVLDDELFKRLTNLKLEATVGGGKAEPLINAYVIETDAQFSNLPGKSVLKVVAMDPTVLMNLDEKVKPWANMSDSDIATAIFNDYGFTPKVEQTQPSRQEVDSISMQRGTDIQYLQKLAGRNGFECYVDMDPKSGSPEGHFHKPSLDEKPQGVLSVNMGSETNVNSFRARYDMLLPITAEVTGLDIETQSNQPAKVEGTSIANLGSNPAVNLDRPRKVLLSQTGLAQIGELQSYAQAMVDQSSWAITAEGELNAVAYGGILRAKKPVLTRGAGRQFSGLFYIDKVLHIFENGYIQRFTMRRNALGLTKRENFIESDALPS